jgi:ribosome biogenesis GTPase
MQSVGLVVASHGRHVMVESPDGERVLCHPKGKKNQALVGDRVRWSTSGDEGRTNGAPSRLPPTSMRCC